MSACSKCRIQCTSTARRFQSTFFYSFEEKSIYFSYEQSVRDIFKRTLITSFVAFFQDFRVDLQCRHAQSAESSAPRPPDASNPPFFTRLQKNQFTDCSASGPPDASNPPFFTASKNQRKIKKVFFTTTMMIELILN